MQLSNLSVLGVTRPNFLLLTPVCLLLGLIAALASGFPVHWGLLWAIGLGGLMAHVSVNSLNEFTDYRSGLDFLTTRTPFSGGSGTLVQQPEWAPGALAIGVGALLITLIAGVFLLFSAGWGLLPLGLLGLMLIVLYSGPINRNRYLVLIGPGLGFGPFMVMGTEYALTGQYSLNGLLISLIPFFQVNNLLFLNQIPDVEPDRYVGRDNFAIALKPEQRASLYALFGVLPYVVLIYLVAAAVLPITALLALATLPLFLPIVGKVHNYQGDLETLIPSLGKNVAVTLLTPLLLTLGASLKFLG